MNIEDYLITNDGLKIDYNFQNNNSQTLVFIHGLAMNIDSWHHQLEHFKEDYSILAYDLRGHGKSSKPKDIKYYSLENFVEDIDTLTNHLEITKFNIIGFSLGGSIALRYAQLKPEKIDKLIAINAPYTLDYVRKSFFYQLEAARKMPKMLISLGLNKEPIWKYKGKLNTYRKCFLECDINAVMNIIKVFKQIKPELNINVEHLLIHSRDDEIVKPEPLSQSHIFIEKGHHYVIAQKPEEVNNIISSFLKKSQKA
ncbi:MAG: alpha/beta hydrolase [Nanoarchaeota archaeon]|nr:alpha/beta hydrolase [Nanoarchaeota archaeon]